MTEKPNPRSNTSLALIMARDYLLWLVEFQGVEMGGVAQVRKMIDKAIKERDQK